MKIEQHIYTRERRGLFRQNEGYDTVAASAGLELDFIKRNVHPYCMYPTAPAAAHPPAVTVVNYPCGRMLIGQAVYREKDFTGLRAAFFVHNYILPPEVATKVLGNMAEVLARLEFLTEYDIAKGTRMDSLESLPQHGGKITPYYPGNFEEIWRAVCSGGKVYVATDNPVGLLVAVYRHLPVVMAHKLGVCTHTVEMVNKKGIGLVFLAESAEGEDVIRALPSLGILADVVMEYDVPAIAENTLACRCCDIQAAMAVQKCIFRENNVHPAEKLRNLSHGNFFQEISFWQARFPELDRCHRFAQAKAQWVDNMLDGLSATQLATIPQSFIKQGKTQRNPEIFVMLGILKAVAASRHMPDLRYLLGSYIISPEVKHRTLSNIKRINEYRAAQMAERINHDHNHK
ncbi:MAG: hypothetical protein FWC78_01480 [Defluviitaleaceae bacterium]|nr:hypothetical protein [Defluviitaleaceae bacterium]